MPMSAGFARIENPCKAPVTITAAASSGYAHVSVHETRIVDGISRMRAVPMLTVPARGVVQFKPGGLHLMLMQPSTPLKVGDRVQVSLRLKDGRVVTGTFQMRDAPPRG